MKTFFAMLILTTQFAAHASDCDDYQRWIAKLTGLEVPLETGATTIYYPNGALAEANGTWYYQNGALACANGTVYYQNGALAEANDTIYFTSGALAEANGTWYFSNGALACANGTVYSQNGAVVETGPQCPDADEMFYYVGL